MPAPDKLLRNPGALCNMVRRIALEAGEITLKYFEEGAQTQSESKDDGSPVTKADQEAEAYIHLALSQIVPEVPIVGEEAAAEGALPDLAGADYFWLVDPLDGTKEFIGGSGDYTVNIALIHKGEPVLGVVYAPAKGVLYAAHGLDTAVRWLADIDSEKNIEIRKTPKAGLTVVASMRHGDSTRMEKFLSGYKVEKIIKRGSSLKICAIAEGKADFYPRFGPTCEWDTAAGDAILRSAGGLITDLQGQALTYGHANRKFLNPEFVASSFAWFGLDQE